MARDAYRNHEEATRARLAQLEIELENSQKRVVAIRLDIAATELRYPAKSTETRQAAAILLLGADLYLLLLRKVHLNLEGALFLFIIAIAFFVLALPINFSKVIQRRADRGKLEEAERARAEVAQHVAEAKAMLGPAVADEADSDEAGVVSRKKT